MTITITLPCNRHCVQTVHNTVDLVWCERSRKKYIVAGEILPIFVRFSLHCFFRFSTSPVSGTKWDQMYRHKCIINALRGKSAHEFLHATMIFNIRTIAMMDTQTHIAHNHTQHSHTRTILWAHSFGAQRGRQFGVIHGITWWLLLSTMHNNG